MSILKYTFLLVASIWSASAVAQSNAPIRLNKHYFEIPSEDSINHVYNKIKSYTKDSIELEQIYTLNNTINRVIKTGAREQDFQEKIIEQYDSVGDLIWMRTTNLVTGKFLAIYFFDSEEVGRVSYKGGQEFMILRSGETEPRLKFENDYEPRFAATRKDWQQFLGKKLNLTHAQKPKTSQLIHVAIFVDATSKVTAVDWANPTKGNEVLAAEYLRVVKLWGNGFNPAIDAFGSPVGEWLYIPFRVKKRIK
jgi:hypothetical protein